MMYFYYHKSFEKVGIQVHFFCVLCEKDGKLAVVLDKQSVGSVMIDLN